MINGMDNLLVMSKVNVKVLPSQFLLNRVDSIPVSFTTQLYMHGECYS